MPNDPGNLWKYFIGDHLSGPYSNSDINDLIANLIAYQFLKAETVNNRLQDFIYFFGRKTEDAIKVYKESEKQHAE